MIGERLTASGRHQSQRVATLQDRLDDTLLTWAKSTISPILFKDEVNILLDMFCTTWHNSAKIVKTAIQCQKKSANVIRRLLFILAALQLVACAAATERYAKTEGDVHIALRDRNPLWSLLAEQDVGAYKEVNPSWTDVKSQTYGTRFVIDE